MDRYKHERDNPEGSGKSNGTTANGITGKAAKIIVAAAAIGAVGTGIAYFAGREGPHNVVLRGEVMAEKELYGNALVGYATERPGVKGILEKTVSDLTRPGEPMRLYTIQLSEAEYDTKRWFRTTHHVTDSSEWGELVSGEFDPAGLDKFYIQTEGDAGDVGDVGDFVEFTPEELGRISNTFALRGVRYSYKDENGEDKTLQLNLVIKESRIKFQSRDK